MTTKVACVYWKKLRIRNLSDEGHLSGEVSSETKIPCYKFSTADLENIR
jgi:hypothetical protein